MGSEMCIRDRHSATQCSCPSDRKTRRQGQQRILFTGDAVRLGHSESVSQHGLSSPGFGSRSLACWSRRVTLLRTITADPQAMTDSSAPGASSDKKSAIVQRMEAVLAAEAEAIRSIRIDDQFVAAVEVLAACKGKVLTTGIGKAGHIARKFAATLCSTATPADFIHPAEAAHGDLGLVCLLYTSPSPRDS